MSTAIAGTRRLAQSLGRLVALAAIIVGLVLIPGIVAADNALARVLVALASAACVAGGVLFLVGLDRFAGRRSTVYRRAGWILFTAGFLLPTSLQLVLVALSLAALLAALNREKPTPGDAGVDLTDPELTPAS